MTTQRDRVLAALRGAGSTGIDQTQFEPPVVLDGRAPILRLAARIDELKAEGFAISSDGPRRHKCAVYRLAGEPSPRVRPVVVSDDGFVRRQTCRRCMGIVVTPCLGAGSYTVAVPPYQADTGCLSTREQEAPRVAA